MNVFDYKLQESGDFPLKVMYKLLDVIEGNPGITTIDITGGSPEFNSHYEYFIKAASKACEKVQVRTNLAIYAQKRFRDIPEFMAKNKTKVIVSLPCYTKENVEKVRGNGTYGSIIEVFKRMNELGYGKSNSGLEIDIVFNPVGAELAPDQQMLEDTFRSKLKELHGIDFNHLIALSNMPIGRLKESMQGLDQVQYLTQMEEKFNPETVKHLMCRDLISIAPDGKLYDCDFWQMINRPVKCSSSSVYDFDMSELSQREISTNRLCLLCTAGSGSSCSGALVNFEDDEESSCNCTSC